MIGFLRGVLRDKRPPWLTLEANGVGYELEAPLTVFYDLPDAGQPLTLHTHLVVREDAHLLYGFTEARMRDLFRSLLKVNGVGPKVALAVLSGLSVPEFLECVAENRLDRLTRVPGIGRKTAERLALELKDKMPSVLESETAAAPTAPHALRDDLLSALVHLGYSPAEAEKGVARALKDEPEGRFEDLLRRSLRALSGR